MSYFYSIVPNVLIESVGWTLLHFVWQAFVVAACVLVLLRLNGRTATQRYAICCFGLCVLSVLPVVTFPQTLTSVRDQHATVARPDCELDRPDEAIPGANRNFAAESARQSVAGSIERGLRFSSLKIERWRSKGAGFMGQHLAVFVAVWGLGVLVLSTRTIMGLIEVRRLRVGGTALRDGELLVRFENIVRRMNVRRVDFLLSSQITVPSVIGCLRPAILVPTSMICGMPAADLEAILAHELAHVRRLDGLVNMLQATSEIFLFFHPVVWWISKQIRIEREYCCDDEAIADCGSRVIFARALQFLEERRCHDSQLAMAANGASLIRRVRRIVQGESRSAAVSLPIVCGCVAIAIAIAIAIFVSSDGVQAKSHQQDGNDHQVESIDLPVAGNETANIRLGDAVFEDRSDPGKRFKAFFVEASKTGRSAADLVTHFARSPGIREKSGFFTRGSIVNMESLVSGFAAKHSSNEMQANVVHFNVPEGSDTRAVIRGAKIEAATALNEENYETVDFTLTDGSIELVGPDGTVRATAMAADEKQPLTATCSYRGSEVVMKIRTSRSGQETIIPVKVTMNLKTDAPADADDAKHRAIGYAIFPEDKEAGKPFRMKMQWKYDMPQLVREAEQESGKTLEQLTDVEEYGR